MSLSLKKGLWCCHAGCGGGGLLEFERRLMHTDTSTAWSEIYRIIGRPEHEAVPKDRKLVGTYLYLDEEGKLLYRKLRFEPKSFVFQQPDNNGGWRKNLNGVRRVLYRLTDLVTAPFVFVVEGERKGDHLRDALAAAGVKGFSVTCSDSGAGNWRPEYSPYFTGRLVVVLRDNDPPGLAHQQMVCATILPFAAKVKALDLPGLGDGEDIGDWLTAGHPVKELLDLIKLAPVWTPQVQILDRSDRCEGANTWNAEGMESFLAASEEEIPWLVPDVLAPGHLTQIFAPRGIGKSLLADHWAVQLASNGRRVLILDRDNPRYVLSTRLRGFGADDLKLLKVISREKCPPLTKPEKWAEFPYAEFDLVIVDSLDSMAEGMGEQDSSKPARAMAPLLDICHRENGPAVLLLGNTVKSGAHSRGSGVVEDRADVVYEVRDATDFKPSGQKPWIEELPAQGASEWAARSARRKGRTRLRLALVATKFRSGEEPAPRMLEINTENFPWTVTDATIDVDAEGETQRQRVADEKAATLSRGVAVLLEEIDSRVAAGQPEILKKEAETLLMMKAGVTQKIARQIINSDSFANLPVPGPGHGMKVVCATEIQNCRTTNEIEGSTQPHFGCPVSMHPTEINPTETPMNTGDFETHISVALSPLKGVGKEHSEALNGNGEQAEWL